MKKRFLSCTALCCLLCLLLTSCTAGLPGSALFNSLTGNVGGFATRLGNLLNKNTPIVINGECDYTVVVSQTASQQVRDAVGEFCDAVKVKTGVDITLNTKQNSAHRILIGDTGEQASKAAVARLNAANFYIGFDGRDLVVQATGDFMLCEALRYLCDTYLNAEKANAGEGYFYLPADADFIAPTLLCTSAEFTIVRAEEASARAVQAVNHLHEVLLNTTGVRLTPKTDLIELKDSANVKEILVGCPARPESNAILASLDYDDYYIGVSGNKFMILAKTDAMLEEAIQKFIEIFISSATAEYSVPDKTLSLPTFAKHQHSENSLLLANEGESNVVLIYPEGADTITMNAVKSFCSLYKKLTNCTLSAYPDSEKLVESDHFEIILGATNRRDSQRECKKLSTSQWTITLTENALTVATQGSNANRIVLNHLGKLLTEQTERYNNGYIREWNENGSYIKTGVNRLLALPVDLFVSNVSVPDLYGNVGWAALTGSTYYMYTSDGNLSGYVDYCNRLAKSGYQALDRRDSQTKFRSSVYHNDEEIVSVNYAENDHTLRVVIDSKKEAATARRVSASLTGKSDVEPFLMQSGDIYTTTPIAMGYVMRLCDGSFIVINGGNYSPQNAEALAQFLLDNTPENTTPVIACWILTDGTGSTVGSFVNFVKRYAKTFTLYSVLTSFPTASQTAINGGSSTNTNQDAVLRYAKQMNPNVKLYKARTGSCYAFAGCDIEVLLTLEDHAYPKTLSSYYDASMVVRATLSRFDGSDAQKIMFLGNVSSTSCSILTARYGSYLQSDVVQVAGGGHRGGSLSLYNAIAAPVVLWPTAAEHPTNGTVYFERDSWSPITRSMLKKSYAKVCYVACYGTQKLTLAQLAASANGTLYGNGMTAANAASPSASS